MPSYDPSLFNVDPYYDDFSEDKKFLRLMFRPGYAVQARELTQLQTVLQNQIERLGSHIFEEGSIVLDGQISENRVKCARISTSTTNPSDFVGVVMGRSGRSSARIVHAENGLGVTSDNYPVLFFEYTEGGTGFQFNDIIAGTAANGSGITASITGPAGLTAVNDAIVVSVERGVRFVEGYFVLNTAQSLGAYSLSGSAGNQVRIYNSPTTRVGFNVSKEFVTATDDESLNDPAFGYYNYAAPGSDRFSIDLELKQYGYTASDTSAVDNFSRVGFVEFMRIVDGDVVKVEKYPDYAVLEDTLARRTYDESGNYTVVPFELELKGPTTVNSTAVLKAELSPGKAYVFGYEFETQAKTKLNIPCARGSDHEREINRNFVRYVGPNTKVTFSGIPESIGATTDFSAHPLALLSSGESGEAFVRLGTARLRGVEPYQGGIYNLGIYDINLGTASFDSVRRVFIGQTGSHAFMLTGDAGLEDENQSSLLFRVPEGSGVTSFSSGDYAVVSHAKQVAGALPFTFTITQTNTNLSVIPAAGQTIALGNPDVVVFDEDGNAVGGTAARGANPRQLSITVSSGTTAGKQLHIIHTVEPSNDNNSMLLAPSGFVRTKTEETLSQSLTGPWISLTGDERGATSNTLYLNAYTDVLEVLSLTGSKGASSGINILSYFIFDNGQRDSIYDWSRLTLMDGVTGISGPYQVTFRYYSHSDHDGCYSVASYPNYETIPSYVSKTTGEVYSLRDCLDFRPDRSINGDSVKPTTWIPANTSANDNTYEYTHHLARTDKIVLTRDRQFNVLRGIPSVEAEAPPDDPNAMSLYTVRVNPYTFSKDDAAIRFIENKRYTMRDIGNLEKRIEAVEYYTTLNLLEQDAKAKSIRDDNGDEMPKRGILVDQFKGHAVADNEDPMFSASVDEQSNEVRPAIDTRSYDLNAVSMTNVTGNATDGVYTLDFTQSAEISNLLASDYQYINPFSVINYMGTMNISPSTDKWFNDKAQSVVKVNVEGENDNFQRRGERPLIICPGCPDNAEYQRRRREEFRRKTWGAAYNSWETRWFGASNDNNKKNSRPNVDRNKPIAANATGLWNVGSINASNAPEGFNRTIVNKTIRKDVVPLARKKEIAITAKGLKPNTDFRVFCDDMDVTPFCLGSSLKTDFKGEVGGLTFYFNEPSLAALGVTSAYTGPEQQFTTGRHVIRIIDSQNIDSPSSWTMAAEATYIVEGAINSLQENGQLSTRIGSTLRKSVKSGKVVSNLQEILTSSGEIRGYAEPMSQTFYIDPVKYPNGIFLKSVDLYFKTKESLTSIPVTVQIRPTLSGYPHPSKVLPFAASTLYSESVSTGDLITSGDSGKTNFPFTTPIYLLPGQEYAMCVSTNSPNYSLFTGMLGATVIRSSEESPKISITKQPFVRSLFKPQNTGKMLKMDNESLAFRLNVCKFTSSGTMSIENAPITDEEAILYYNEFRLNASDVTPEKTAISYSGTMENEAGAIVYSSIAPNKNIPAINGFHQVNSSLGAGTISSDIDVAFSTSNSYVSPIFDLERSSLITVSNVINNNNTSTPGALYNGELEPTNEGSSTKAASRYISKRVTLEEGMEAENITVIMSLCNPRGSSTIAPSVKVFVRPIPVGEPDIDNVGYTELVTTDTGESTSDTDFREVTFTNIGSVTLSKFRIFSIKVTMFGDPTGASYPKIKNLRIIAT